MLRIKVGCLCGTKTDEFDFSGPILNLQYQPRPNATCCQGQAWPPCQSVGTLTSGLRIQPGVKRYPESTSVSGHTSTSPRRSSLGAGSSCWPVRGPLERLLVVKKKWRIKKTQEVRGLKAHWLPLIVLTILTLKHPIPEEPPVYPHPHLHLSPKVSDHSHLLVCFLPHLHFHL